MTAAIKTKIFTSTFDLGICLIAPDNAVISAELTDAEFSYRTAANKTKLFAAVTLAIKTFPAARLFFFWQSLKNRKNREKTTQVKAAKSDLSVAFTPILGLCTQENSSRIDFFLNFHSLVNFPPKNVRKLFSEFVNKNLF